jgi:transcriptional regulator with XRE-family HTH domain
MGRRARTKQDKLGEKLRHIREALDLSQNELLKRLALEDDYQRTIVSSWESGDREPSLRILLKYAHLAGICLDLLVDDDLSLPRRLPTKPRHMRC